MRKVLTLGLSHKLLFFAVSLVINAQRTGIGTSTPSARFHIYTPSNWFDSVFMISHGGTVLLNITSSGRVGIGTAMPGATFHVVGTARISSLSSGGSLPALIISDNQGNLSILAFPNDTSKFLRGDGTWQSVSGDNWGSQRAVTSGAVTGTGVSGDAIRLINGTSSGQVLKWDGSQWVLANDSVGSGSDHDWYKVGTTSAPSSINDNIYTQGKVVIGTNSPIGRLHVANDGMIYAEGTVGSGDTISNDAKTAFIWYPRKAASRAGQVTGTEWDNQYIGNFSVAFGYGTRVEGSYSSILGGYGNEIVDTGSRYSVICGGNLNSIAIGGDTSFIGSGYLNKIFAGYGVIGGGAGNRINGSYSFIGGGENNTMAGYSVVAGGYNNGAGNYAVVSGGKNNDAGGTYSTVAGGRNNYAGDTSTVGGGAFNRAQGIYSTISGGRMNYAWAQGSTIGGGEADSIDWGGYWSVIGGGDHNGITLSERSTIGEVQTIK